MTDETPGSGSFAAAFRLEDVLGKTRIVFAEAEQFGVKSDDFAPQCSFGMGFVNPFQSAKTMRVSLRTSAPVCKCRGKRAASGVSVYCAIRM